MTSIPYVISMGHPDYKRPRVSQSFLQEATIEEVIAKCVQHLAESIKGLPKRDWKDMDQIYQYHASRESYIENSFWQARVFVNGDWQDIRAIEPNLGSLAIKLSKQSHLEDEDENEDEAKNLN